MSYLHGSLHLLLYQVLLLLFLPFIFLDKLQCQLLRNLFYKVDNLDSLKSKLLYISYGKCAHKL